MLGKIQMLLIFVVDWISWDGMWIDEREGLDSESLLDSGFINCLCNLISIDR